MQILLHNRLKYIFILIITYSLSIPLVAEEFVIDNNDLIISGAKVEDVDKILSLLENNENINRVVFNGVYQGGQTDGLEISDLIIDFELDTHIIDYCWGNCIFMFMGGQNRTMAKGSELAINMTGYRLEFIEGIIENKDYEVLGSLSEYIVWVDETAREEIIEYFTLLLEQGVKPSFIIESIEKASKENWIPRRKKLLEANILTK
tara:strand:- start:388 stop:1002 length:615 start_codon:yes stop_codon:yes gene_type:complete